MKKTSLILFLLLFVLIGCVKQQDAEQLEMENKDLQAQPRAEIEYKANFNILKTKSYKVKTEYVYNTPKHRTEIKEITSISLSLDKADGSDISGAVVKIKSDGQEFSLSEGLFPGLYSSEVGLSGGEYNLLIDVDGDGKNEAEESFIVPGSELTAPEHGSKNSNSGFGLSWQVFGDFKDYQYTYSLFNAGDGYCRGKSSLQDIIKVKDLFEPTTTVEFNQSLEKEITDGLYQLMFKTIEYLNDSNRADGVQFAGVVQEITDLEVVVGNICQCCNHFEPPCDQDLEYPNCHK